MSVLLLKENYKIDEDTGKHTLYSGLWQSCANKENFL